MTIYYAGVLRNETKPAFELSSQRDVTSFYRWTRENYNEFMTLFSKTVAERTQPGQRQVVEKDNSRIYAFARSDGLAAIVITDLEYPNLVAQSLLSKLLDEFTKKYPKTTWSAAKKPLDFPELVGIFKEYQEPEKIKGITSIQRELDETKVVLHKTIEQVLERGEKLDTLVAKSDELSWSSRQFYASAKDKNSCCTVM